MLHSEKPVALSHQSAHTGGKVAEVSCSRIRLVLSVLLLLLLLQTVCIITSTLNRIKVFLSVFKGIGGNSGVENGADAEI